MKKNCILYFFERSLGYLFLSFAFYLGMPKANFAQVLTVDSLEQLLVKQAQDTNRIKTLNELAYQVAYSDSRKSFWLAQEAYHLSEKLSYEAGKLVALVNMGNYFTDGGKYGEAIRKYEKALGKSKKLKNLYWQARIYNNLGLVYRDQGNHIKSLEYYNLALEINLKTKNEILLSSNYNNIGLLYLYQNDYDNALKYFTKAREINRRQGNELWYCSNTLNIAIIYSERKMYDKAKPLLEECLSLSTRLANKIDQAIALEQVGKNYMRQENYPKAIDFLFQALEVEVQSGNKLQMISSNLYLGYCHIKTKQLEKAEKYLLNALSLSKELGTKLDEIEVYKWLSEIYKEKKDYLKSLDYLHIYKKLNDSLYQKENLAAIEKIKNSFENKLKDSENAQLKEKLQIRNRMFMISVILLLFFVFFIFYLLSNRKKYKQMNSLLLHKNFEIKQQNEKISSIAENLKQANEAILKKNTSLEELGQLKNKLLSIICHDFKSPVNSLKAVMEVIKSDNWTEEQKTFVLSNLTHKIDNVMEFSTNLIHWAYTQMDGFKVNPSVFDLNVLVQKNIELTQIQAEQKYISFHMKLGSVNEVFADRDMINSTLLNLIHNAIKFSPENGRIYIRTFDNEREIGVSIKDNGVGMSEENIQRILKRGEKISTYGTVSEKGTGLGLQLCKEYVEKNGGRIHIASQIGQGMVFSFSLPKNLQNQSNHCLEFS